MLAESLPPHIFLYTCEWDMLLNEGLHFVRRLEGLGKKVRSMMIEKVPHAWDKSPNPFRDQAKVDMLYRIACAEMRSLFEK
jgi:acetyl esterase/lipase